MDFLDDMGVSKLSASFFQTYIKNSDDTEGFFLFLRTNLELI